MARCLNDASPRYIASRLDARIRIPRGAHERFEGYGVMGLPFSSGHVLALRRFRSSSLGFGYSSLWHRTPEGDWTFYADVDPPLACTRYFGSAVAKAVVADIRVEWIDSHKLDVYVPAAELEWSITLADTPATRGINRAAGVLPGRLWRSRRLLSLISRVAGHSLDIGNIRLHGRTPNGQRFIVNPRLLWSVNSSKAVSHGTDLGCPAPLEQQVRLGDFWIPNRGIFAVGQVYFEPFDASRHRAVTSHSRAPDPRSRSDHRSVVTGEAASLD